MAKDFPDLKLYFNNSKIVPIQVCLERDPSEKMKDAGTGCKSAGWYCLKCGQEIKYLRSLQVTMISKLLDHQDQHHNGLWLTARWFHLPSRAVHTIKSLLRFYGWCSGQQCKKNNNTTIQWPKHEEICQLEISLYSKFFNNKLKTFTMAVWRHFNPSPLVIKRCDGLIWDNILNRQEDFSSKCLKGLITFDQIPSHLFITQDSRTKF